MVNSSKHMDQCKKECSNNCSFFRFKNALKQLQKHLFHLLRQQTRHLRSTDKFETTKKGHFSVLVFTNGKPQKFSVALRYLAYPPFVKLLDAAEEEYWFNQKGVLMIPCEASDLRGIISEKHIDIGAFSRKMTCKTLSLNL